MKAPIRFAGKTLRHAGHLGAGKRRAATELNTQARKYKIYLNKETKELTNYRRTYSRTRASDISSEAT